MGQSPAAAISECPWTPGPQARNYRTQAKQGRGRDSSSMAGGGMGSQWGASRVDVKGSDSMAGGRMVVGCGAW